MLKAITVPPVIAFIAIALSACEGKPPPPPQVVEKTPVQRCRDLAFGMRVLHGPDFEGPAERVSALCSYAGQSSSQIASFFKNKVNSADGSTDELLVMTHVAKYIDN